MKENDEEKEEKKADPKAFARRLVSGAKLILTIAGKGPEILVILHLFCVFCFVASTSAKGHEVSHQYKIPVVRPGRDH